MPNAFGQGCKNAPPQCKILQFKTEQIEETKNKKHLAIIQHQYRIRFNIQLIIYYALMATPSIPLDHDYIYYRYYLKF